MSVMSALRAGVDELKTRLLALSAEGGKPPRLSSWGKGATNGTASSSGGKSSNSPAAEGDSLVHCREDIVRELWRVAEQHAVLSQILRGRQALPYGSSYRQIFQDRDELRNALEELRGLKIDAEWEMVRISQDPRSMGEHLARLVAAQRYQQRRIDELRLLMTEGQQASGVRQEPPKGLWLEGAIALGKPPLQDVVPLEVEASPIKENPKGSGEEASLLRTRRVQIVRELYGVVAEHAILNRVLRGQEASSVGYSHEQLVEKLVDLEGRIEALRVVKNQVDQDLLRASGWDVHAMRAELHKLQIASSSQRNRAIRLREQIADIRARPQSPQWLLQEKLQLLDSVEKRWASGLRQIAQLEAEIAEAEAKATHDDDDPPGGAASGNESIASFQAQVDAGSDAGANKYEVGAAWVAGAEKSLLEHPVSPDVVGGAIHSPVSVNVLGLKLTFTPAAVPMLRGPRVAL